MPSSPLSPRGLASFVVALAFSVIPQAPAQQPDTPALTLQTSVRRVVLDVVVTDGAGKPVRGLTARDFTLTEDHQPQRVLSFEANGFNQGMDYLPPKLPAQPANTFVNLPQTPEKGPLYVLLYDLVNMDNEDQMDKDANQHDDQVRGRQQLVKFIQSKPEGSRFALYVWSDGLHLVQGFTSDKELLFAAIDPSGSRPHVPKIFLMGENSGRASVGAALETVNQIGRYLDGLPGRKNLIWFSGTFPLDLYPNKDDPPSLMDESRKTLDLLARNQIAIYPVDVRGVVVNDWHSTDGLVDQRIPDRGSGAPAAAPDPASQTTAGKAAHQGNGQSLIAASYGIMDEIARETGGHAFYGSNDVSASLTAATETGGSYYTLTYSPTNKDYNGKIRSIHVESADKSFHLAYRRSYYGLDTGEPSPVMRRALANTTTATKRPANDTFDAYMKHGAPMAHQLIFAAHVRPVGTPAKGTPEQMAQLATQPAYAKMRKAAMAKPVPLQRMAVDFTVMAHQLHLDEGHAPLNLELACAAYDRDGVMLNSVVDTATNDAAAPSAEPKKALRAEQEIAVPLTATSLRIAIQDANTGRVGAMEVELPLAPENQAAATTP